MKDFSTVKNLFKNCFTPENLYQKIIALGRELPPIDSGYKTPENIVKGCQSIVYLHTEMRENKLFFSAFSDALISAGLAALLLKAYNGETPETILQNPPTFLGDLQIHTSLTPGRSNGLASMFLRMQKDALNFLVTTDASK
ncbi:MAG: Cysteine desulfuration protein SufE [Chlamydiae bacterium]|nr:Cysteine desulfuration protein SufE [Chlamydiota bacterium]